MRSFAIKADKSEPKIVYPIILEMVGNPDLVVLFTGSMTGIALMRPTTDRAPLSFVPEHDWASAEKSNAWRPYAGVVGLSNT